MRIYEIMSEPVQAVSPDLALKDAAALMQNRRIHHLLVTQSGAILGALSKADIERADPRDKGSLYVSDVMSTHVAELDRNDTVRKAANLMRGRSVGCVAVTQGGRPVGIVTIADLLTLLGQDGSDRRVKPARATLNHRVPHRRQPSGSSCW